MQKLKYSIIMPCYNEAHVLTHSLASIKAAIGSRSDTEILLLDNGSNDDSIAIAEQYEAKVHHLPNVKISALRNQGARLSEGEYLLFLDADIQVPGNWLDKLDEYVSEQSADVVGFVDDVPASAPWYARTWGLRDRARRQELREIDALPGRNLFLSRSWFDKVQGFSETLTTGEDKDFVMRLKKSGAKVISDPSLNMIHLGFERSFKEWCRKEYWRQHSHIAIITQQGFSIRLARFPIICVSHLIWMVFIIGLLFSGYCSAAVCAMILWWLPSAVMSGVNPLSRWPLSHFGQFTLLYWLRFHISGFSILREITEQRNS